jgi:2-polyprenyl-6-methoxyphenol hydroxylase-like FAD-dependent oxidoreductase
MPPCSTNRLHELRDWDDVKLLTVVVDRLDTWWRPGLLCLGDAAHAMSPIGGTRWSTYALELSRTASTLSGRTQ